jgi:hypothetical protein
MELLLLTQYFDSVKDVANASKASTLFMSHSPAAVNKVVIDAESAQGCARGIWHPGHTWHISFSGLRWP